jgi:hypothetical protein
VREGDGEAQGDLGASEPAPVGLSHVHIPSQAPESYHEQIKGKFDRKAEGSIRNGPPVLSFKHPTGNGEVNNGDTLYTARRWRDGISIGSLPILERPKGEGSRGSVREFSRSSRARMVRFLREADADYKYMGTLTVGGQFSRDPEDFRKAVDRWLVAAMRELRRAHASAGGDPKEASIFWWVEFQERGAPHLHCYYTKFVQWKKLAEKWASLSARFNLCAEEEKEYFWKTSTKFEKIRAGYRGMISYARKYAYKPEQKQEVEGVLEGGWRGRFWGVRGNRSRGSCHVTLSSRQPGVHEFHELLEWLFGLWRAGKVGKTAWEYGKGWIFYVKSGSQWSETDFGFELEKKLRKVILA